MRRRFIPRIVWWATLAVMLGGDAHGQSSFGRVEPVINRADFQQLVARLELNQDQRFIADQALESYAAGVRALEAETEQRAADAGARQYQAAVDGRIQATRAELDQWTLGAMEATGAAWAQADALFAQVLSDVELVLDAHQRPEFEAAVRRLRRMLMLHSRQESSATDSGYVGDGLDLIQLVEQARGPSAEFACLEPAIHQPMERPPAAAVAEQLARVLDAYESELDRLIQETYAAARSGALLQKRAELAGDASALRSLERQAVTAWRRLFELNKRTADEIAQALAAGCGQSAASAWLERVQRATCPWMFAPQQPDRAWRWMQEHQLEPEQRTKAAAVYEPFAAERARLRAEALATLVRTRIETQLMLKPMERARRATADAERLRAQQEVDAKFYQIITLEAGVRDRLLAPLTELQRAELNRDLRR